MGARDPSVDVFGLLIRDNFLCTCSVMIGREMFDRHGLLDAAAVPADDFDMWLRCMPGARIGLLREPLVEYFRHGGNYSNDKVRMREKVIYVLQKNGRRHAGEGERRRQFADSIAAYYEQLLRNLIDARAYTSVLRHALTLAGRGRRGFNVLYRVFAAPTLTRVKSAIRYRLGWFFSTTR